MRKKLLAAFVAGGLILRFPAATEAAGAVGASLSGSLQKAEMSGVDVYKRQLLEDIITENKQAIEMAHVYTGILNSMMDTFSSVISNNVNGVMKFLTTITIVMAIPTMVFSAYGMNLNLSGIPFSVSHDAVSYTHLVVVVEAMAAITLLDMLFASIPSRMDNLIRFFNK